MDISIRCIDRGDIDDVARLANCYEIARMTANLPFPYTREHAVTWLDYVQSTQSEHVFAILAGGRFSGVVGLVHESEHGRAELGYWLGEPFWNQQVMTAAAGLAVGYAFAMLNVNKVYARCFTLNAASRRVLEKNGFLQEGCLRAHHVRLGVVHDVLCYGLLRGDYDARKKES